MYWEMVLHLEYSLYWKLLKLSFLDVNIPLSILDNLLFLTYYMTCDKQTLNGSDIAISSTQMHCPTAIYRLRIINWHRRYNRQRYIASEEKLLQETVTDVYLHGNAKEYMTIAFSNAKVNGIDLAIKEKQIYATSTISLNVAN